jgi:hypothetical protein
VGGVHETTANPGPATAVPIVGEPGTVAVGTTALLIFDVGPVPAALNAETLKRYVVPGVKPRTTRVVTVDTKIFVTVGTNPT